MRAHMFGHLMRDSKRVWRDLDPLTGFEVIIGGMFRESSGSLGWTWSKDEFEMIGARRILFQIHDQLSPALLRPLKLVDRERIKELVCDNQRTFT